MIFSNDPLVAKIESRGLIDLNCMLGVRDWQPSQGFDFQSRQSRPVSGRNSLTFFDVQDTFRDIRSQILQQIEQHLGVTHRIDNCETLQLTRYLVGQEYRPHCDHFNVDQHMITDNDRIATAILYLTDGFVGGETEFVRLNLNLKFFEGDILYFEYPPKSKDLLLHAGRMVLSGEKLIATLWIRSQRYQ